jgi:uracil-DNA glycosylase
VLGRTYKLTQERGKFVEHQWAPRVTATIHPSAILRAPDEEERHAAFQEFVADLKRVRSEMNG